MLHGANALSFTAWRIARSTSGATEYGACAARLARTCSVGCSASSSASALATTPAGSGVLKRISS